MSTADWNARDVSTGTLIVLGVALSFWLLLKSALVFLSLLIALVVGSGLSPIVRWAARRWLDRAAAALSVFIILLLSLAAAAAWIVPRVLDNALVLARNLPDYYAGVRALMHASESSLLRYAAEQMPAGLTLHIAAVQAVLDVSQLALRAEVLGSTVFVLLAVLTLTFYWIVYGETALRAVLLLAPMRARERLSEFATQALSKLGAYVQGQLIISLIVGVLSYAAYAIVDLPDAFLLAVLAAGIEPIPILGTIIATVAAGLLALVTRPESVVWIVAAALGIHALDAYVLWPRLMERNVGVDPSACLLAVIVFGSLFGVPGAFLAVPLTALGQLVARHYLAPVATPSSSPAVPHAPARAKRLQDARAEVSALTERARGLPPGEPSADDLGRLLADLGRALDEASAEPRAS